MRLYVNCFECAVMWKLSKYQRYFSYLRNLFCNVVLTLKNLKFIASMKKCELCYRWLTCIFSIEIHVTCLEFFRQVIYIILLLLIKTYILSQSHFHRVFLKGITEQTFIRRGLHTKNYWSQGTFQHIPWVFVLTLLLHGRVLIFK